MPRLPEYVLTEDHSFGPYQDSKVLKVGSFVKPIDLYYVPKHCFNSRASMYYDSKRDVFCYTSFGIIPIPKTKIREII